MDKSVPSVLPPQFVALVVDLLRSSDGITITDRKSFTATCAELLTLFDLTIQMCISDAIRLAREQYVRRSKPANQPFA